MLEPEDSLVTPAKSSPIKAVAAVVVIAAVAAGAWWMFGRGKGQPENPARVLIVGPTPELAGFLERQGFDVDHLSVGEAIGQGQTFDSSLDELPAMLEYADQHGYGYLALNLAHGQRYDFSTVAYEAAEPPVGVTFAVMSVGELGKTVSYGAVTPEVTHEQPAGEKVGLLLALFGQEEIAKAKTQDAQNDLMIRFGSAKTVQNAADMDKGQENMRRQIAAWNAAADKEAGEPKPTELARPYENLQGWPLANGDLLLASGRGAWFSDDGRTTQWREGELDAELAVVSVDALDQRAPCTTLPDTLSLPEGFAVSPAGDALLVPSDRWVADLWVLSGEGCSFEKRDQIRRLDGGELGQPRASGRTAASFRGRVTWADAKMRRYRDLGVDGVAFNEGELRWVSDDVVVVPARLDFAQAARARARRVALAADPEGATLAELPEIDPATLPANREALAFVELPPPKRDDDVQVAVVPVDALLAGAGDPGTLAIRDVFPLPAQDGAGAGLVALVALVALVDGPEGSQLVRLSLAASGEGWANVLATDYDLAAELATGAAVQVQSLAADLPHTAHDLAISPTGSHAAWAAPFGDESSEPLANFEIVLLPLGVEGAAPQRLTDNDRSDLRPRFAGEGGRLLVFDSSYRGADDLPAIEALRALSLP